MKGSKFRFIIHYAIANYSRVEMEEKKSENVERESMTLGGSLDLDPV